eukprot:m.96129 g.96129  ORF g.96129 m.96129 type:complete len:1105 (-) comp26867_c0_seq1:325-3639(-)
MSLCDPRLIGRWMDSRWSKKKKIVALLAAVSIVLLTRFFLEVIRPDGTKLYDLTSNGLKIYDEFENWEDILRGVDTSTLCHPSNVPDRVAKMGLWLDIVGGICTSSMAPIEIRERVLATLELRSTLPQKELRELDAESLFNVAVIARPYLPSMFGKVYRPLGITELGPLANMFQRSPEHVLLDEFNLARNERPHHNRYIPSFLKPKHKIYIGGGWLKFHDRRWVQEERLFSRIDLKVVDSLTNFEYKLLMMLQFVRVEFDFFESSGDLIQIAAVFAGIASQAAEFRFFSTVWVNALSSLKARLTRELSSLSSSQLQTTAVTFLKVRTLVRPILFTEIGKLLLIPKNKLEFTLDEHLQVATPLPRFPWQSENLKKLPAWSGEQPEPLSSLSPAVAVVIPFHDGEMTKLRHFLSLWPKVATSNASTALLVPVVFALNTNFTTQKGNTIKARLTDLWLRLDFKHPIYFLSLNQPHTNHYDGAAVSFFQLAAFLGGFFPVMQILETDVVPIQTTWAELVVEEAQGACVNWWVRGSTQLCSPVLNWRTDRRQDFHINGNAMYAIACDGFRNFLRRVQAFYPPVGEYGQCHVMSGCETGLMWEGGYDHAMDRYLSDPRNYHYARRIRSNIVATPNIQNHCEDEYDPAEIISKAPKAFFVHSKFHLLSMEEQNLFRLFGKIYNRRPSSFEMQSLWIKVHFGALEFEDINSIVEHHEKVMASNKNYALHRIHMADESKFQQLLSIDQAKAYGVDGVAEEWLTNPKTSLQVSVSSVDVLAWLMPILSELSLVVKFSKTNRICAFGNCKHGARLWRRGDGESTKPQFVVCGGSLAACDSSTIEGVRTIVVVSTATLIADNSNDQASKRWERRLRTLASYADAVIVAVDKYAQHYLSLLETPAVYSPGWGTHEEYNNVTIHKNGHGTFMKPTYDPTSSKVLVWTRQNISSPTDIYELSEQLSSTLQSHQSPLSARVVDRLFGRVPTEFELCEHPAIVVLPELTSLVSPAVISFYRLGVPLFVPSEALLLKWHASVLQSKPFASLHSRLKVTWKAEDQIKALSGVATWPGTTTFDSVEDLSRKIMVAEFEKLSSTMVAHNKAQKKEILSSFKGLLA